MPNPIDLRGVIYGSSGTYKTWNLGLISKWIFSITGKPTRLITMDGGGFKPLIKLVQAGIIQPLVLTNDPMRLSLMRHIVQGYWPVEIDSNGIRQGKKMSKDHLEEIGNYVFEGVTSIAESLHMLYRGRKTGMNPAFSEPINSDLVVEGPHSAPNGVIGSFSQDSYGLIQGEMISLINASWSLPAESVWWSGHEASAEDELTRKVVRGIALVGQAATPRIGKNVGYMIHAYRVETGIDPTTKEKKFETRYYFQSHPDNNIPNIFWEAKTRTPGDEIEPLLEAFPGGYFVPTPAKGIDSFIDVEDQLISTGINSLLEWKKDITKNILLQGVKEKK